MSAPQPPGGFRDALAPPDPAEARLMPPDAPLWAQRATAGTWIAPAPCGHPADRALGPCACTNY